MRRALGVGLLVACATLTGPARTDAQGTPREVAGRVVRPAANGVSGVAGTWVVLHRVGRDTAGALDSMRTRSDGRYAFRYRPSGDSTTVYFISTSRGGVAYFTTPGPARDVRGDDAQLLVYDTTSAPIPIAVRGRHVIVTAPDSADPTARTVIEVYELSNDSSVTRVAGVADRATFVAPLPFGVTRVTVGDGDVSQDAIRVVRGRLEVVAPLAPGLKQASFVYQVPVRSTPLPITVDAAIPVLEVLVEDPRATVAGAGLVEVDPVQIEGRPFKRFLAQGVADTASFSVTTPGALASTGGLRVMLVVTAVGAAMLLGLGMAFMRKGPAAFARRRNVDPESLALEVAALDAEFERLATPTEQQRAEHYLARAQLKGRLSAALAKRDGLG